MRSTAVQYGFSVAPGAGFSSSSESHTSRSDSVLGVPRTGRDRTMKAVGGRVAFCEIASEQASKQALSDGVQ